MGSCSVPFFLMNNALLHDSASLLKVKKVERLNLKKYKKIIEET